MSVRRVPGYGEICELGAGAQGRVVLARGDESGTTVAIKYLAAELAGDARFVELFREEARMLARVANPHVARLHEFVADGEGCAIVMEAVDGASLRDILEEHGALGAEASLVVLKGSLLGLAAAHAVGVVHRDYKPANVIVQGDGLSKLVDFGIAVPTGEGSRSGSPAYMAPEQWHAEPATPATDVYAATCVFFECVTGHRPYEADDVLSLMGRHVNAPVPVEEVPEPLRELVSRGMAKSAVQRPEGAAAFVAELEAVATTAYGPGWEERGVRALAVAAAALAALFPLSALGLAPVSHAAGAGAAHGAAQAAGHGTAKAAAVGKGFLATTAAKVTVAVATGAVVGTTVVGVTVAGNTAESKSPPVRPIAVNLVSVNEKAADLPFEVRNARYVRVTGLANPAIEQKVNQALRAPFDQGMATMRRLTSRTCTRPTMVTTKAHVGLRGPVLVSVVYGDWGRFCVALDGQAGRQGLTVDLRSGHVLTAEDIYRPTTLSREGLKTLLDRLSSPDKADFVSCPYRGVLRRSDFLPFRLGPRPSPPFVKTLLKPDGLELVWSTSGSACSDYTFTADYSRVWDLLKPELVALLPR